MEEWSKEFFTTLEAVTDMVDEFFWEIAQSVEEFADEFENTVAAEIDQCLQEMFDPIVEVYFELEDFIEETEEATYGYTYPVEPTVEKNPACIGCRHYHGQVYGGNLFVCAMHPYGWDSQSCPDWESLR